MVSATSTTALPGPPPMPLLGGRGNFMRLLRDPIAFSQMLYQTYGSVVGLARGYPRAVFAFGPEHSRHILTNQELFHSPSALLFPTPDNSAARRLEFGMVSINGAQHKQQRGVAMPAFHKRQVESYHDAIVAITQAVLDGWDVRGTGRPITLDVAREMQRITLRVINKTLFGLEPSARADGFARLTKRWQAMMMSPPVILLPLNCPGTPYRRALAHAERLDAYYRNLIAQKHANPSDQLDVMSILMAARDESGAGLSESELVGHANVLFIAGHDTSSSALTWTLFLLAQHPPVLHEVLDELEGVLRGAAPTVGQLQPASDSLPLLDRVIKESMRVLPPVPVMTRITTAPCTIDGHQIDEGAFVFVSIYTTHHLAEIYSEPERFWPERWSRITPSPYEYLPFGAGPRRCIGASLGMMLLKVVLAMTLQRFRLTLRPGAQVDRQVNITLSPRRGMPMIVAPQDRKLRRVVVRGNVREMVNLEAG